LPQITIEASRLAFEQRVQAFVDQLSHGRRFPDPNQPAPHWEEPLCFEVAGLHASNDVGRPKSTCGRLFDTVHQLAGAKSYCLQRSCGGIGVSSIQMTGQKGIPN